MGKKMDKYSVMTYVLNSKKISPSQVVSLELNHLLFHCSSKAKIYPKPYLLKIITLNGIGYIIVAGIAFFMIKSRKN